MKQFIIQHLLPNRLFIYLKGYGWYGNFKMWKDAQQISEGYNANNIINTVKESLLKVKNGEAVFERDSVLFNTKEYNYEVLSYLMWIAAQNRGNLNIIDFGGSLGSTYYQNKYFLDKLSSVNWNIIEQNNFVAEGIKCFQNEKIHFYYSIDECIEKQTNKVQAFLLSSVLQYLDFPYKLIENIIQKKIEYIIIDRTGFTINNNPDRITVQKVPAKIYKATYPCWFFNEKKFIHFFESNGYNMIDTFDALDKVNIPSIYKGFVFKRNGNS